MEKKFPEDFGLQPKPEDVNITAITQVHTVIIGVGTDNLIYQWWPSHQQWTLHIPMESINRKSA